jgi:hypothetical protein
LYGPLPIAKFQDILPSPLNPNHAFRKKHDAFLVMTPPPAPRGETRLAGIRRTRHAQAP